MHRPVWNISLHLQERHIPQCLHNSPPHFNIVDFPSLSNSRGMYFRKKNGYFAREDEEEKQEKEKEEEEKIRSLCYEEKLEESIDYLFKHTCLDLSDKTYMSILNLCSNTKKLPQAMRVYAHLMQSKPLLSSLLSDYIVITLAKCGAIEDAFTLAWKLSSRTVFSYTAIISAHSDRGKGLEALEIYQKMQEEGIQANNYTFVSLFKACGAIRDLKRGRNLHVDACKMGLELDGFIGNTLVSMYGKCGAIAEAEGVFYILPRQDIVSWNAMLSAYVDQNQGYKALELYRRLHKEGLMPDKHTFVFALHACGIISKEKCKDSKDEYNDSKEKSNDVNCFSMKGSPLVIGLVLHSDACKKGLLSDSSIGNVLVSMYGKCGNSLEAEDVFCNLSQRDSTSWNAMLATYMEQGEGGKALRLYRQMLEDHVNLERHTFVLILQACDMIEDERNSHCIYIRSLIQSVMNIREALHDYARRKGLASDTFVATSLINMYSKCGMIDEARNMFQTLSRHDVVSWTAMLDAYVEQSEGEKVLQLYQQMQEEGIRPDQHAFVVSLQACSLLAEKEAQEIDEYKSMKAKALEIGKALHVDIKRTGYAANVYANNALLVMYGKCGDLPQAEYLFNTLPRPDIVSWTVMLSAYAKQGEAERVLLLYKKFRNEQVLLDDCTLICVLQSCSGIGSLEMCNYLYFDILSGEYDKNVLISASLIHGYGSYASMSDANRVFDAVLDPDVAVWTACIAGYAVEGDCITSLKTFDEMQTTGIRPNKVTLTAILSACSHSGLVVMGLKYFTSTTRKYNIFLDLSHYGSLVDLLGRVGDFKRLESMLNELPLKADMNIWFCVLSACRIHGNEELGKHAFIHAVNLHSNRTAAYDLMMNIYADSRLGNDT